jgi:GDPmannose 4,6-dehydratase
MRTKTALITGVLGQDGSLLAELLLSRGYKVIGMGLRRKDPRLKGVLAGMEFVADDITNPSAVRRLLQRFEPDELYHLAAVHHSSQETSISRALIGRDAMIKINFHATKVLAFSILELKLNCNFVFASTSQIFTPLNMTHKVNEKTPRSPSTFYGHVKSWSMDLLTHLRNEAGLRTSSAILFNHESPKRGLQFVSRKITNAAARAASGLNPRLALQNIGARVDWSSASDVVQALSLIGQSMDARDYVVGSGKLHSIRHFLDLAFQHVNLDWTKFTTFENDILTPTLVGQADQIKMVLKWAPISSFEQIVINMVNHDVKKISE